MKHNLSLYILSYMLRWTVGECESSFKLSDFRKENRIPYSTFNRHLSSLIRHGFVTKLGRDNYRVSREFLRVCGNYSIEIEHKEVSENQPGMYSEIPF